MERTRLKKRSRGKFSQQGQEFGTFSWDIGDNYKILQDLRSFFDVFCYDAAFGLDVSLLQQDGPSWAAHTLESTTVQPGVLTVWLVCSCNTSHATTFLHIFTLHALSWVENWPFRTWRIVENCRRPRRRGQEQHRGCTAPGTWSVGTKDASISWDASTHRCHALGFSFDTFVPKNGKIQVIYGHINYTVSRLHMIMTWYMIHYIICEDIIRTFCTIMCATIDNAIAYFFSATMCCFTSIDESSSKKNLVVWTVGSGQDPRSTDWIGGDWIQATLPQGQVQGWT